MADDNKQYLGDSVYADYDGYQIQLYLDNGFGAKNEICMEPDVMHSFIAYAKRMGVIKDE